MRTVPTFLLSAVLAVAALPVLAKTPPPSPEPLANVPVPQLDVPRYTGLWYEIAHLPMFFQRKCVDNTTARYIAQQDGSISVRNRCRAEDGSYLQVDGEARQAGESNAQLEVRFAPGWMAWLPMVWGDYWVIALDDDYQWSMVGTAKKDYLWILSRTPTMDAALRNELLAKAKRMGYPVENIELTPQDGNPAAIADDTPVTKEREEDRKSGPSSQP